MHQKIRFLTSTSLAVGLGIVVLGGSVTRAEAQDHLGTGDGNYIMVGALKSASSSAWKVDNSTTKSPEIESTDPTLSFILGAPDFGAKGFNVDTRLTWSAGVKDDFNTTGYFDINENNMRDATSDVLFDTEFTYKETLRFTYSKAAYYSFAKRFHPYLEAGAYYAQGSEATMKGSFEGACDGILDSEKRGTTVGLVYGAGMLVTLTKKLTLLASYNINDNVDFKFRINDCGGEAYEIASFDSKIKSYGLALAYDF